jgi:ComF family protein
MRIKLYQRFDTLLVQPVLDLFFPALCFICENRLEYDRKIVCPDCFGQIPGFDQDSGDRFPDKKFDSAYILFHFNESVRLLIHLLKYKGYFTLADYFADAIVQSFPRLLSNHYDHILPVPLHQTRLRERGFNQSAVLGTALGKKLGRAISENILIRRRNTPSQTYLNRSQRVQNVADAFYCRAIRADARVLLIDDVITTGSTINACCQALRQAGAAGIDVLALAHPSASEPQNLISSAEII